jgi:uncharacterized protein (DUF305 family)
MKKVVVMFVFVAINYACNSSTVSTQQLNDQLEEYSLAQDGQNEVIRQDSIKNSRQQMIEEMQSLTLSGFADKDYADLLIIHHRTTQRLAGFEFARGQHLNVARTAEKIASKDNKEMLTLKNFSLRYKQIEKTDSFKVEILQFIKAMSDTVPSTGTVDNRFIDMMIGHEQIAIDISKIYLKYAHDSKLRVIALKIILNNQNEIPKLRSIKPD